AGGLVAEDELRGDEVDNKKPRKHYQVGPKVVETKPFREGADTDRLVPGRGKAKAKQTPAARKGGHGYQQTREVCGRNNRDDDGGKHCRDLSAREGRNKLPEACRRRPIQQGAKH